VDAEILSCRRCALSETRQRVVVGSGPVTAPLMIIGEAPGASEDAGGEPFIGRSGRLLFSLISDELGLSREQCFVTNVVKCRPPGNRPPRPAEIAQCRPWLDRQLAEVSPRCVVALGRTAARTVLGVRGAMADEHGRVRHLGAVSAIATYHPAAALRHATTITPLLRADLASLRPLVAP
jgi:uracil-DNA glycosylase